MGVYGAMAFNCSRVLLYKVAQTRAGREVLDVGIYQNRHWKVRVKTVRGLMGGRGCGAGGGSGCKTEELAG